MALFNIPHADASESCESCYKNTKQLISLFPSINVGIYQIRQRKKTAILCKESPAPSPTQRRYLVSNCCTVIKYICSVQCIHDLTPRVNFASTTSPAVHNTLPSSFAHPAVVNISSVVCVCVFYATTAAISPWAGL